MGFGSYDESEQDEDEGRVEVDPNQVSKGENADADGDVEFDEVDPETGLDILRRIKEGEELPEEELPGGEREPDGESETPGSRPAGGDGERDDRDDERDPEAGATDGVEEAAAPVEDRTEPDAGDRAVVEGPEPAPSSVDAGGPSVAEEATPEANVDVDSLVEEASLLHDEPADTVEAENWVGKLEERLADAEGSEAARLRTRIHDIAEAFELDVDVVPPDEAAKTPGEAEAFDWATETDDPADRPTDEGSTGGADEDADEDREPDPSEVEVDELPDLESVPGVGGSTVEKLEAAFGDIDGVRGATAVEIEDLDRVGPQLRATIQAAVAEGETVDGEPAAGEERATAESGGEAAGEARPDDGADLGTDGTPTPEADEGAGGGDETPPEGSDGNETEAGADAAHDRDASADGELTDRERLERHLREATDDAEIYFKSKFLADDVGMSARTISALIPGLRERDNGLTVEKWSYTNATTWRVQFDDRVEEGETEGEEAEADDGAATEQSGGDEPDAEEWASDDAPAEPSDEERVERVVAERSEPPNQSQIADELGWSVGKTAGVLSEMVDEDRIEKHPRGRQNLITLVDDEGETDENVVDDPGTEGEGAETDATGGDRDAGRESKAESEPEPTEERRDPGSSEAVDDAETTDEEEKERSDEERLRAFIDAEASATDGTVLFKSRNVTDEVGLSRDRIDALLAEWREADDGPTVGKRSFDRTEIWEVEVVEAESEEEATTAVDEESVDERPETGTERAEEREPTGEPDGLTDAIADGTVGGSEPAAASTDDEGERLVSELGEGDEEDTANGGRTGEAEVTSFEELADAEQIGDTAVKNVREAFDSWEAFLNADDLTDVPQVGESKAERIAELTGRGDGAAAGSETEPTATRDI